MDENLTLHTARRSGGAHRCPYAAGCGDETEVSEFTRGAVRLHILHHAAKGEIHGSWMSKELAHHGYQIFPGTLYPMLHRMQDEALRGREQSRPELGYNLLQRLATADLLPRGGGRQGSPVICDHE
jgi:hypothetical protein